VGYSGRRRETYPGVFFFVQGPIMEKPPVCNYEGSDYQERFWEKGGRSYEDAVEAVALKRLLPPSGSYY
jgi:hypothetical protein